MSSHTAERLCSRAAALVEQGEFAAADRLIKDLPALLGAADAATIVSVNKLLVQLHGQAEIVRSARRGELLALRQTKGAIESYRSV